MISVIIPAYNAQAYLRECLESVLAQSFTDWEALVIDDGSTDSTAVIAEAFANKDRRIRSFRKTNGGLSDARNYGLDRSMGDWVTFLDSDDCLMPHALEIMHGFTGGDSTDVVAGEYSRQNREAVDGRVLSREMNGLEATREGLYQRGINTSACCKLYRRSAIGNVRFKKGIWYEDLDFFSRLFPGLRKVVAIDAKVYFYRDNTGSFINTFSEERLDVLQVTLHMEQELMEAYPSLRGCARDRRLSANFNMFCLLAIHDRVGRYRVVSDECWEVIKSRRWECLLDPSVRIKNKAGCLVSYLGRGILSLLARLVYR